MAASMANHIFLGGVRHNKKRAPLKPSQKLGTLSDPVYEQYMANRVVSKNEATQEIEDAIRAVLANLDHLQPFTTKHFNVFPCKSEWERVCQSCFRHPGLRVEAYPFILILFLEAREAPRLHTAKRPVDETQMTGREPAVVTPHYRAVRHAKRSRMEPSGGSPAQLSCWEHEALEGLQPQLGGRREPRPRPDGLEAMVADKGEIGTSLSHTKAHLVFPSAPTCTSSCVITAHVHKADTMVPVCSALPPPSSPASKVVIRHGRHEPEGAQGKQACESKAPPPGPSNSGDTSIVLRLARKIFPLSLFFGHGKN